VSSLAQKDIDLARQRLAQKRFGEAETAILRADRTLAGLGGNAGNEVATIKYQVYFKWAQALYTLKKYGSADQKVTLALRANRTTEAVDLKTRIAKAASYRDYDAEIDDMLARSTRISSRGPCRRWKINRSPRSQDEQQGKEREKTRRRARQRKTCTTGIASTRQDYGRTKKFTSPSHKPDLSKPANLERTRTSFAAEGANNARLTRHASPAPEGTDLPEDEHG
jgi:hypothetical protein